AAFSHSATSPCESIVSTRSVKRRRPPETWKGAAVSTGHSPDAGVGYVRGAGDRIMQARGHPFLPTTGDFRSIVDAGDQLVPAEELHGHAAEPDVEARFLREQHLVAGVDSRSVGSDCRDDAGATAGLRA